MSVQLPAITLTHEKRKDRSTQSTSEIQRKVETRFYLRQCTCAQGKLGINPWYLIFFNRLDPTEVEGRGVLGRRNVETVVLIFLAEDFFKATAGIEVSNFWQKSPWCWWGLGCHSPSVSRGHGPAPQTVHRYCPCMDLKVGKSLRSMLCICSGPSTWGFSDQLICINDIKIIVIINTMAIAYATHNCISPTLAIKHRL